MLPRTAKVLYLVLVVIFYLASPANAQKYTYPYGVEAQGVPGAKGVDTLVDQLPGKSPSSGYQSGVKYLQRNECYEARVFRFRIQQLHPRNRK